jgi:bloom syndrome protein/3-oxo-5-alpha-steroid 4-dehydrogenase 1
MIDMPLARSDSLQDIDFTLRRQFNKTTFRYGQHVDVILYKLWLTLD